jgi:hypothetical protein
MSNEITIFPHAAGFCVWQSNNQLVRHGAKIARTAPSVPLQTAPKGQTFAAFFGPTA